jgi:glucokinase
MILAGDIGGTSTRLALFEIRGGQLLPIERETFSSRAYKSLNEIVGEFLQAHPVKVEHAAFGIAGPVRQGRVEATNLPWVIDAAQLASELVAANVSLLNDLEANTYGIFELAPKDFAVLNAGSPSEGGNIGVISAGTGLGEAGAAWDGTRFIVFATEGGHTDFAPRSEEEIDLLRFLQQRFGGRVSYERVLSGPGLYTIYQFLRDTGRAVEDAWLRDEMQHSDPSALIGQYGMNGKSELCVRALDWFVSIYGAEAGNLALKLMATRGIFVGGGIAPKILPKLQSGAFLEAFCAKGRFEPLLRAIPVRVLLNDQAALLGAARYAGLQAGLIQKAVAL